ncbi:MAG: efflux RND transporter periplasmic adaptor subunit [bacterium]
MNFVRLILMSLCLVCFMALISCGDSDSFLREAHDETEAEDGAHVSTVSLNDEMLEAANLEIVEVGYRQMKRFIRAPAKVIPNQNRDAHVGPLIEGRAGEIFVNQGDRVHKGQILMYLESPQAAEAKAAYYKAKAELAFAEADHERHKKLFEEQIGSGKALAEAEAAHNKALAEVDATEKGLHAIGFSVEEIDGQQKAHEQTSLLPIKAPISGMIVERNVTIGQRIEPSSDVFHIIDLSELWVDADIYEKDFAQVKLDDVMEIRVPAYADETFKGKMIFISDVLDERTRTFKVRAAVKNPNRKLKPEMFADTRIFVSKETKVLAVPKAAVQFDGEKQFVYIAQGSGNFLPITVETGRESQDYVEVISGLNAGDKIVGRGSFLVKSEALKESFGEGHH